MTEWREVELGELIDVHDHRRVPISRIIREQRQGEYRYYGAQGVIDHIDDYIFDGDYILVAEDGENLRSRKQPVASIVSGKFWVNNHAHIIKGRSGVADDRFLAHAINVAPLSGLISGAAQPKLTQANLQQLPLPCPDFPTQQRLGSFISVFDELIEINERRIELLENLARSLYREWFVRFRFPDHEHVEFVDSELGPIPEGWVVTRFGDVVDLRYGKSLPARRRRPGEYAVVSSAGVIGEHDEALVKGPGIVVGRKGNAGSIWWVDRDFFPIDTTYYVVSDQALGLLYWQLQDLEFIDSHAAVPGLSREQANALPLLVPSREVAATFGAVNDVFFGMTRTLRDQVGSLAATRDLLLPRLVTGRLDMSEVDLGELLQAETA